MKQSKFGEEQRAIALRLGEFGAPVGDVSRQSGISEATFSARKKKYANLGVAEFNQLKVTEEEPDRFKGSVVDLKLDRQIQQGNRPNP